MTDDYRELFQYRRRGRWFTREDDAATWKPVVLNRRMAQEVFGDANPIGQIIKEERDPNDPPADPNDTPELKRVIGVVDEFRQRTASCRRPATISSTGCGWTGRIPWRRCPSASTCASGPGRRRHSRKRWSGGSGGRARLVIRDPAARPERQDKLRQYTLPLAVVGTIAVFLLLMVALGLTGVVWQSVTQRIREFGLRRAKGADDSERAHAGAARDDDHDLDRAHRRGGDGGAAAAAAASRGAADVPGAVFVSSIAISVTAIYLLTLACGWYPSRLATKIPAGRGTALRVMLLGFRLVAG